MWPRDYTVSPVHLQRKAKLLCPSLDQIAQDGSRAQVAGSNFGTKRNSVR